MKCTVCGFTKCICIIARKLQPPIYGTTYYKSRID